MCRIQRLFALLPHIQDGYVTSRACKIRLFKKILIYFVDYDQAVSFRLIGGVTRALEKSPRETIVTLEDFLDSSCRCIVSWLILRESERICIKKAVVT